MYYVLLNNCKQNITSLSLLVGTTVAWTVAQATGNLIFLGGAFLWNLLLIFLFRVCHYHTVLSVPYSLVATCWERVDLMALLFIICLLVCFVALHPKSTAVVIAGRSVHQPTLFPGQA